jgi:hypothetical protein
LYNNTATVNRSSTLGSSSTLGGLGGGTSLGGTGGLNVPNGAGTQFNGATSAGIRRAPSYTTEIIFPRSAPIAPGAMRTNIQGMLTRGSSLRLADNIRVSVGAGGGVVLRGNVRNAREARVAEMMVRMTPGVRAVRNELVIPPGPAGPAGAAP